MNYNEIKNGDCRMGVSNQDVSKQRTYLNPMIFKDAIRDSMKSAYLEGNYNLETFKGFNLFATDGSELELPNTPESREGFDVQERGLKETDTPKARVSIIRDLQNDFIIDSIIDNFSIGEHQLAYRNIERASEIVDLKKSIVIFDRNYASSELFLLLLEKESHFIFRLKSDSYIKERSKMKTNDEWVQISLTSNRKHNIKNEELKKKAEELGYLNLRIVNIKLKTGEIETVITNLPEKIASSQELKELYGARWGVEKGYNVMKNRLDIENFTGKRRICIEQDFYAQTLMFNMLVDLKNQCMEEKKENEEDSVEKCEYDVNMNLLAGKLKINLFKVVFAENEQERKKYEEDIAYLVSKHLIKNKNKPSTPRKKTKKKKFPYNNRKNC